MLDELSVSRHVLPDGRCFAQDYIAVVAGCRPADVRAGRQGKRSDRPFWRVGNFYYTVTGGSHFCAAPGPMAERMDERFPEWDDSGLLYVIVHRWPVPAELIEAEEKVRARLPRNFRFMLEWDHAADGSKPMRQRVLSRQAHELIRAALPPPKRGRLRMRSGQV